MTHESHFNGDTLTLTSPRGQIVLSQGQCAAIVVMAEKNGPVGRVRPADAAEGCASHKAGNPGDYAKSLAAIADCCLRAAACFDEQPAQKEA